MSDFTIWWGLDDDPDGNIQHIAEHDLSVDEVEDVLRNPRNKTVRSRTSGRWTTFGWTSTDIYIAVVWDLIDHDPKTVYPVTAYPVDPRSR